jgi:hypothetical protein
LYIGGSIFRPPDKPTLEMHMLPFASREETRQAVFANTMLEPVSLTPMLKPLQLTEAYNSAPAGAMQRLRKTDFALTAANWEEVQYGFTGNWFILSKNSTIEKIVTNRTWDANQGFFVRFVMMPTSKQRELITKIWFGQYRADLYSDGGLGLYTSEGTDLLDIGYVTGGYNPNYQYPSDLGRIPGQMVTLYILPVKRNEIVFFSSLDGGWAYKNVSLKTDKLDTITSAGKFGISFPSSKAFFQMMPLVYPESGTISIDTPLPYVPESEVTRTSSTDVPTNCSISIASPVVTPRPNGGGATATTVLTLNSPEDRLWTPFIYRATLNWPGVGTTVISDELEITRWRSGSMVMSIPEDRACRSLCWINDDQEHIDWLNGKSNRAVRLMDGANEIFVGVTDMPEILDPRAPELHAKARDLWKRLERARIKTRLVADNKVHTELFRTLLKEVAGVPDDRIHIAADPVQFKIQPSGRRDQAACEFDAGTPVSEILTHIRDTYTGWVLNVQPMGGVVKVVYAPLESFPTDTMKYLYATTTPTRSLSDTYWREGFKKAYIEPEATYIRVIGLSEYGELIVGEYVDEDAEDASLPENSRPDNWAGERLYVGYQDYSLLTQEMVNIVTTLLAARLTRRRVLVEFMSEYDCSIWPGYIVELEGIGKIRIMGFEAHHDFVNSMGYSQPTSYVGELYVPGVGV